MGTTITTHPRYDKNIYLSFQTRFFFIHQSKRFVNIFIMQIKIWWTFRDYKVFIF